MRQTPPLQRRARPRRHSSRLATGDTVPTPAAADSEIAADAVGEERTGDDAVDAGRQERFHTAADAEEAGVPALAEPTTASTPALDVDGARTRQQLKALELLRSTEVCAMKEALEELRREVGTRDAEIALLRQQLAVTQTSPGGTTPAPPAPRPRCLTAQPNDAIRTLAPGNTLGHWFFGPRWGDRFERTLLHRWRSLLAWYVFAWIGGMTYLWYRPGSNGLSEPNGGLNHSAMIQMGLFINAAQLPLMTCMWLSLRTSVVRELLTFVQPYWMGANCVVFNSVWMGMAVGWDNVLTAAWVDVVALQAFAVVLVLPFFCFCDALPEEIRAKFSFCFYSVGAMFFGFIAVIPLLKIVPYDIDVVYDNRPFAINNNDAFKVTPVSVAADAAFNMAVFAAGNALAVRRHPSSLVVWKSRIVVKSAEQGVSGDGRAAAAVGGGSAPSSGASPTLRRPILTNPLWSRAHEVSSSSFSAVATTPSAAATTPVPGCGSSSGSSLNAAEV